MSVRNWFKPLKPELSQTFIRRQRRARRERSPAARPLRLETLEDRRLLAFDLAASYSIGDSPQAAVTADFNNDGRRDLATANFANSHGSVSVLLGNADGSFQPAQTSPAGLPATSLAVGDFNADGKLDLATTNWYGANVLLGNGNGTFQAPVSLGVDAITSSVAVGDFNNDGKLDLVVTLNADVFEGCGYYGCYSRPEGRASILLGNGNGTFQVATTFVTGYHATSVAVADLNGDGKQDLAVTNSEGGLVTVCLGTGTGTFGALQSFATGYYPWAVAAADVNADGKVDLVTANYYGGTVSVLLGNGAGSFGTALEYAAGGSPLSVAVSDFNGDGKADLMTANQYAGVVSVLLGAGGGVFKPPVNAAIGTNPYGLTIGDFNGDGRTDAASFNSGSNNVSVLLNNAIWPALSAPSLAIQDVSVTEGNTGTVNANFVVSLSAASSQPVTVRYATADGTAVAGSDYQAASGTLTFAPGVTSRTVTVLVNGDRLSDNSSEFFFVHLSDPTNAFVSDGTGAGTIIDDEPFLVIVDYVQGVEGNTGTTPFVFTVTLSAAYDVPVSVDYATAESTVEDQYSLGRSGATSGVDFIATSGTLTIPAGQTSGTITVPVIGDRVGEDNELFVVKLSNPTHANIAFIQALAEIVDDEPFVFFNGPTSVVEGNSGTKPMTFTVSLSAVSDAAVTVSYATADGTAVAGSDYQAAAGTLTIPAGQLSETFTVLVNGDLQAESDEYFMADLTAANGATISSSRSYAMIYDDDTPPTIAISDASVVEGNSGTRTMTFSVSLSRISSQTVSVNFATANGSAKTSDNDYVAKSGTISFAPGEIVKTIDIVIKGDTKKEQDEKFYVNLSSAVKGTIGESQGIGTILNDDGGGKASAKGRSQTLSAASVDAAILDWMFPKRKKSRG
jgi:hypothetical protein